MLVCVGVWYTNISWPQKKEDQVSKQNKKTQLTNFESCLLGRAVVVHFTHKRTHLHGVLVLMVEAVSLKETQQ